MSLRLLALLALLHVPSAAATPGYGRAATVEPSSLEREMAASLPKGASIDPALSLAARELAQRALTADDLASVIDPKALRLSLARAGAVAPEVAPLIARGPRARALAHLANVPHGSKEPMRHGIGAVEKATGEVALVVLSAPDRLRLDPFPVQVEVGSVHVLSGQVHSPLQRGEIHLRTPAGTPASLPTAAKGRGSFSAPVTFAVPGAYTLEVIGHGPKGPVVAAILEVFAGEAPPSEPETPRRRGPMPEGVEAAEGWTVGAINGLRKEKGLGPLAVDEVLARVARRYAEELLATGEFAHRSRISGDLSDRLEAVGYRFTAAGENLGQAPDVILAHQSILDSPGHLANVLSPKWKAMGIGVAQKGTGNDRTVILVQVFATRR